MKFLEKSKPNINKSDELSQEIKDLRDERKEIGTKIGPLKEEIQTLDMQIKALKAQRDERRNTRQSQKGEADNLNEEKLLFKGKIKEIYQKMNVAKEEYYKKMFEVMCQQADQEYWEKLHGVKKRMVERERKQKQWEKEKEERA